MSPWVHPCLLGLLAAGAASAAEPPAGQPKPGADDLYDAGRQLFDQYAPPEVKQQYDYPSKEQFDDFLARVQRAYDSGTLKELAAYEPQVRSALALLRVAPGYSDYADWLAARLEEMNEAGRITAAESVPQPAAPGPERKAPAAIPYYDRWFLRESSRPVPARAAELMPELRAAFAAEGVPPELAWLAEVESSLNPLARNPSGARGLFQLMPETARSLGLSTFLPDERTDPGKSAHAAARDLRALRTRFGSWPLALAAYNAGEGRVQRALTERHAHDFAGIAGALPGGTRMYVPEVCALVAVRTGVPPERLAAPR